MTQEKLRVGVLYGGCSGEHEMSTWAAACVVRELDRARFEVIPIAVDRAGRWFLQDAAALGPTDEDMPLPKSGSAPQVQLLHRPQDDGRGTLLITMPGDSAASSVLYLDVVFSLLYGPQSEDGTIQGLLELTDIPYVGSSVLSAAVSTDKEVSKRLVSGIGIPVVPYVTIKEAAWARQRQELIARVRQEIGYPCFVKPVSTGSSLGVHKVKEEQGLEAAVADALSQDPKILVEKAVNAREIEVAVLENPEYGAPPLFSVPDEVIPLVEFFSYEAKYLMETGGSTVYIPARIPDGETAQVQRWAQQIFQALDCEGMARVDFFLDRDSGTYYFNEINILPSLMTQAIFCRLWAASGVPYGELLNRLVDLALARHARRRRRRAQQGQVAAR